MSPKKIVVVDDDETIRKTFFLILQKKYLVYLAKDSQEALERFTKGKVDLIIADLKLPRINGLRLISKFRELGYKGEVIMISAYPDLINEKELNRLSISDFFVKPLDLEALNRSIDFLLNSKNVPGARSKEAFHG
ncbi:MAG: response regulator [Candidatus Aminicenantes bacterium]|nr:response regulator [Candidatus Aminicenantes bacterium]